jgi:protein TonB
MAPELTASAGPQGNYFDALRRRNGAAWWGAALVAGGLNLILFMLIPALLHSNPPQPLTETLIPRVTVIRLRRAEPPTPEKVEPPKPPEKPPVTPPKKAPAQPLKTRLRLPFELNPRLPAGPGSLELPPMEGAALSMVTGIGELGGVPVGELDAPLTPLTRMPPLYPMRAKRKGIEGWVKVKFLVDTAGTVGSVTILEAQPTEIFDQSVRRCLAGWRFKPGTVEGMPVKTWVTTTIRFELE